MSDRHNDIDAAEFNLPSQFEPLSMWNYFFLGILYAIPLIGLIFLFMHATNNDNINRRNYARSYFITAVLYLVFLMILIVTGVVAGIMNNLS